MAATVFFREARLSARLGCSTKTAAHCTQVAIVAAYHYGKSSLATSPSWVT